MINEFSTFDIQKALGIPLPRLREWISLSFISPTIPTSGQGKRSIFDRQGVYAVQLFRQLADFGIEREHARLFVKFYQDKMKSDKEHSKYMIIRYGKLTPQIKFGVKPKHTVSFADDGEKINLDFGDIDNHKNINDKYWNTVHVVNLKILHHEVDVALEAL